ncbi:MAG TPA: glycoside hydrolase family 3 N-terminal domain-containing protein [Pseudonocardiaceae bacterium]|nr:glycoside hydrolase family 3 N-terminal domain-containing protein [Pseudonocardiaceae bacterium]
MRHRTYLTQRWLGRLGWCAAAVLVLVLGLAGVVAATRAAQPVDHPAAGPATGPAVPPAAPPEMDRGCDPVAEVARLPLRRRLAQLVMVGVDPRGPAQARAVVAAEQVGGIFIGGTATGLLHPGALDGVQQVAKPPVLVAVDEEGGRVQRVDAIAGSIPSARQMAANLTAHQVYELARRRGAVLRASGVTVDFAPIVDVSSQPDDEVIGDRSFAADPEKVIRYADAFARGLRESGVLPVFKHFPGHGRAEGDSHQGPVTTPPLAELRREDLVPYRRLLDAGAAAVMIGHLDVPGLTAPGEPASISPPAVALLRDEIGYHGLVISDDLGAMRAITDRVDLPEAVRQSLAAGVDMALWTSPDGLGEVLDHLEQSVHTGTLPPARVDEAVLRVLHAKGLDPCRPR